MRSSPVVFPAVEWEATLHVGVDVEQCILPGRVQLTTDEGSQSLCGALVRVRGGGGKGGGGQVGGGWGAGRGGESNASYDRYFHLRYIVEAMVPVCPPTG